MPTLSFLPTFPCRTRATWLAVAALLATSISASAATPPQTLNFQGRVAVNGIPYNGTGHFKFALLTASDAIVWRNAPDTTPADGEPDSAFPLAVAKGLYAVVLGEGMDPLPAGLFAAHGDLRLRVWFNDGTHGIQLLTPDQSLASVAYAHLSETASSAAFATTADSANSVIGPINPAQLSGPLTYDQLPATVARLDSSPQFDGTVTAGAFAGQGTLRWVSATQPSLPALPNTAYLAMRDDGPVTFLLPAVASVGDVIRLQGAGKGGWIVRDASGEEVGSPPETRTWVTRDSARSWTGVAASEDGHRLMACAWNDRLYVSDDFGEYWTPRESVRGWEGVAMSADGSKLFAWENNGGIYRSTDGGLNWTAVGQTPLYDLAVSADATRLAALDGGGQLWVSIDAGENWLSRSTPIGYIESCALSGNGSRLLIGGGESPLAVSTDLGLSWTTAGPSLPWMAATASADGMRFAAVAVEVFVLPVGQTRHIYTTADGGVNWTARLSSGRLSYYPFPSIAMSADGGRLIAAESGGTLLTSTDAGATWVPEEVARYWTGVAVSGNGRVLVACADAGPIVTSARQVLGPDLVMELHYAGNGRWEPTLFTTVSSQGVLNPERIPAALTGVHTFDSAVGIGTDTPVASLDVRGNLSVVPTTPAAGISLTGAGMPTAYYLKDGTGERGALGLALQDTNYSDDAAPGDIVLRSAGNPAGKLMLQNGPGAAALTVVGNRVGIGTTAPGTALEVRGNVLVQGTVTQTSDARFKSRVASLGNALDTIEALRGVKFEWTPERQTAPGHVGRQLGFLAQEVATVLPELVHTNTDGYLSLNYSGLTPVLVEAVKELEQRIATRLADKDAQIVALERRQLTKDTELDALRTRMSELEATLARLATRQTASDPHPVTGHRDPDAQ